MKSISILGSTGSIGTNALRVIDAFPDAFCAVGLAGGRNIADLASQVQAVRPVIVSCWDRESADDLQALLRSRGHDTEGTRFVHGREGNIEVACHPAADMVLSAISGAAGLVPTHSALEAGKSIALANKETLVMAGRLMMDRARQKGVEILPVDSEHNAIHQCLRGGRRREVRRLILTASGGPFLKTPRDQMPSVTPGQALNHPTWNMGRKITIDSATLMNKGLEVIEASWLFGVPPEEIEVTVHPQSIVHSMVEFVDGSILAHLGLTDMRLAIQYALSYPERWNSPLPSLDISKLGRLEFEKPDREKFRCLNLAYAALAQGGTAPAALNAANEVAVDLFLNDAIGFHRIPEVIESVLASHAGGRDDSLESILEADAWGRREAQRLSRGARPKRD